MGAYWAELDDLLGQERGLMASRWRRGGGEASAPGQSWRGRAFTGLDVVESRPWQMGDDSRRLDRRATARTGVPHVKVMAAENNHRWRFLVDLGPSMCTGTWGEYKAATAAKAAAFLGWRLLAAGNEVEGQAIVGQAAEAASRPLGGHSQTPFAAWGGKGRSGYLQWLKVLAEAGQWAHQSVWQGESRAPSDTDWVQAMRRQGLPACQGLVWITDAYSWSAPVSEALARWVEVADLTVVLVRDRLEWDPPLATHPLAVSDREAQAWWALNEASVRKDWVAQHAQRWETVRQWCERSGSRHLCLSGGEDATRALDLWLATGVGSKEPYVV